MPKTPSQQIRAADALRALHKHADSIGNPHEVARIKGLLSGGGAPNAKPQVIMKRVESDPIAGPWLQNYLRTVKYAPERHLITESHHGLKAAFPLELPPGSVQTVRVRSLLCPTCGENYYGFAKGQRCPKDDTLLIQH